MKKMFIFAATMLAAVAMNAQHVTPLDTLSTKFVLDSMRITYANNAAAFVIELTALQTSLERDGKMLKEAEEQIKEEQNYSKNIAKYTKTAQSILNSMQKTYSAEEKLLKQQQGACSDLQSAIHQLNLVKDNSKAKLQEDLTRQTQQLSECLNVVNTRLKSLAAQTQYVQTLQNNMAVYDQELKNKAADLKVLQNEYNTKKEAIKKELTGAKANAKVQKQ